MVRIEIGFACLSRLPTVTRFAHHVRIGLPTDLQINTLLTRYNSSTFSIRVIVQNTNQTRYLQVFHFINFLMQKITRYLA